MDGYGSRAGLREHASSSPARDLCRDPTRSNTSAADKGYYIFEKDNLPEKAKEILNSLQTDFTCNFEEKDSIGKRYRRQDAIGTPFCITVDHETLENNTITLRNRDDMSQERVNISDLKSIISAKTSISNMF